MKTEKQIKEALEEMISGYKKDFKIIKSKTSCSHETINNVISSYKFTLSANVLNSVLKKLKTEDAVKNALDEIVTNQKNAEEILVTKDCLDNEKIVHSIEYMKDIIAANVLDWVLN